MLLQNCQNFTEMTSNMIYVVAFCVGTKCLRKIHLNTQTMPTQLQLAPKDFDILAPLGWQLSLQVDALDANRVSKSRVWRSKYLLLCTTYVSV